MRGTADVSLADGIAPETRQSPAAEIDGAGANLRQLLEVTSDVDDEDMIDMIRDEAFRGRREANRFATSQEESYLRGGLTYNPWADAQSEEYLREPPNQQASGARSRDTASGRPRLGSSTRYVSSNNIWVATLTTPLSAPLS